MMWLKSCPRCDEGDMYLNEDDAKHCFQRGFTVGAHKAAAMPLGDSGPSMALPGMAAEDANLVEFERLRVRAVRAVQIRDAG